MESPEKASVQKDQDTVWVITMRHVFSGFVLLSIVSMILCLTLLSAAKTLRLDPDSSRLIFRCLYIGALGFAISAAMRFFLDIMYGILGLLQVKVASLIAWLVLSLISIAPLAAIFAFMRLASSFHA